jgi:methyl-accepting chemotaxis protein
LIGAVGFSVQANTAQTVESDIEDQLILEAEAEATQLSEWLTSNEMPVRLLSAHPTFNRSETKIRSHIDEQLQTSLPDRVEAVHVVDTGREVIVTSTENDRINDSVSDTSWIRRTSFTGFDDVINSDPYRNSRGDTVMAFMSPVTSQPRLAVVLVVPADNIEFNRAIEGTFTEVVRPVPGSTQVLFSDSPREEPRLQPYIPDETQADIPEIRNGVGDETGFRTNGSKSAELDSKHVVAYAPVEGTDWVVIKHTPAENAFALREDIRWGLLLFVGIALAGVIVIGGTVGRNTAGEIRRLSRKATEIERGNYDVTVSQRRSDEIGRLSASLDSMRVALKQRIRETERSRKEAEQLNEQLQVLDRLLRHNLNNDMNVIILQAESIKQEDPDSIQDCVETIVKKSNQLLEKTDKQRKITQALSTESPPRRLDAASQINSAVETTRAAYPEASITVDTPESAPVLATDQLQDVIQELLENAIEHSLERPEVDVTLDTGGATTTIRIADNGPPIPEMDREVLTSNREIDPLNHGSGIGLWLVFWIVRRAGGHLGYEETTEGKAITVYLHTPDRQQGDRLTSSSA